MRRYQAISNRYALLTFLLFLVPVFWHFECLAAELRLTWVDNSTDEDGFGIDRKTVLTGTYTTIASVGPAITTYTDAGLLDDTEYCYRIYAFNSATTSSYSDEACGITLPAPVADSMSTNISQGAVLSGTSILWTATPSEVPARVEFSIDEVLYWTEFSSIYQFNGDPLGTLDTTTLSNGSHELRVRAVYADNSIAEKIITMTVSNSSTQQLAARIGIFRPSTGEWFLDLDGNGAFDGCGIDICLTNFGRSGMRPVVGDWYGTGKTNIGVYEPWTGTWHLDDGNGTWDDCESTVDLCITSFGAPGSFPVTKESSDADQLVIGFFQPKVTEIVNGISVTKLGQWKFDINGNGILDSCTIDQCIENFGQSGDLPVVGNWDGAGEKIGIFRPQSGEWLLDFNDNGMWDGSPVDRLFGPFGQFGDRPVVGDWDGSGVIRIGVFRPSTGQWFLDMNGNGQLDDCSVDTCIGPFGQTGDRPVVGKW
jgi:hypothetical protein